MKNMYRRMYSFLWPHRLLLALSIGATLAYVALDGVSLWFASSLLNTIFSGETATAVEPVSFSFAEINAWLKYVSWNFLTRGGSRDNLAVLQIICLLIPVLFALKNSVLYVKQVLIAALNFKTVEHIRQRFYTHIMRLPMSFFNKRRRGDIISHLVKDVNDLQNAMTTSINSLLTDPLKLIFFIVLLYIINARLTLIVFLVYPLLALIIGTVGRIIRRRAKKMLRAFSDVVAIINETVAGIKVVKMFSGISYEEKKFSRANRFFTQKSLREKMISHFLSPFNEFISLLMTSALLWFAGRDVLAGESDFSSGDFLRFLIILFSTYAPIKKLTKVHTNLQRARSAAERIFTIMDEPTEDFENGRDITALKEDIVFDRVCFSYPGYEETVLQDLSFTVHKGEMVAFVGSSGSGKSTILDLLPAYYPLTSGEIRIDGVPITEYRLDMLRRLFGTVSQETVLFNDTVAANIAYGRGKPDMEKVRTVIRAANAEDFIRDLPEGVNTVIGENGVTLSGGQRQRLAIARALYIDPEILILDEATSALDTESERVVQKAVDRLIQDRTTFVVAHRLSTIQRADRIIVLENGQITETGTHRELLARNGRYRGLYNIQFT
ncbi:MAG: ABC transporter ATP-binding protein [Fibrobacterota bacterium]